MPVIDATPILEKRGTAGARDQWHEGYPTREWYRRVRVAPLVGEGAVRRALEDAGLRVNVTTVPEEQTVLVEMGGRLVPSEVFDLGDRAVGLGYSTQGLDGPRTAEASRKLYEAESVIGQIEPKIITSAGPDVTPTLETALQRSHHYQGHWMPEPLPQPAA